MRADEGQSADTDWMATGEVAWARELAANDVETLAVPHAMDGLRFRMAAARHAGRDVTDELRKACASLS